MGTIKNIITLRSVKKTKKVKKVKKYGNRTKINYGSGNRDGRRGTDSSVCKGGGNPWEKYTHTVKTGPGPGQEIKVKGWHRGDEGHGTVRFKDKNLVQGLVNTGSRLGQMGLKGAQEFINSGLAHEIRSNSTGQSISVKPLSPFKRGLAKFGIGAASLGLKVAAPVAKFLPKIPVKYSYTRNNMPLTTFSPPKKYSGTPVVTENQRRIIQSVFR
jgi:hypothetical protein